MLNSWWKMFEIQRKQRLLAKNTEVPLVFLGSYFGFRREAPGLRCDAEIDGFPKTRFEKCCAEN